MRGGRVLRIAALVLSSRPVCYNHLLFKVVRLGDGGDPHANRWAFSKTHTFYGTRHLTTLFAKRECAILP